MKKLIKILPIILSISMLLGTAVFAEPLTVQANAAFINDNGEIIVGALKKGIDVSFWQGEIDWNAVKGSDVSYAILRCGYGDNTKEKDDSKWFANADACTRLGIPFGTYLYSHATCIEEAIDEAEHTIRLLSGYNLSYPVFYDMEAKDIGSCSNELLGIIADAFCNALAEKGYQVGIYANLNWWTTKLTSNVFDNPALHKWVAQYSPKCTYEKPFEMWQSSSTGSVPGIAENVDIDFLFNDGINHDVQYKSNIIVFTIDKIESFVFGKRKTNDVAPIIRNERTMLPARFLAENLGARVE